jgi:16S rRNA (guanine527-N7)-methyltransferase
MTDPRQETPPLLSGMPLQRLREGVAEILARAGAEAGAGEPPGQNLDWIVDTLARYAWELQRSSRTYGLISVEDAADPLTLVVRHVLDSAAGAPAVNGIARARGARAICDLGSGAGLPGIPLAAMLNTPGQERAITVNLVERREKRVRFLLAALPELGLPGVTVFNTDAERPSPQARAIFLSDPPPVVVFRAYQQMNGTMLRRLVQVFPVGTTIAAWKGRRELAEQDAEAINEAPGLELLSLQDLHVPFLDRERSLLVFERVSRDGVSRDEVSRDG